jgi:hypothetical protein
MKSDDALDYYFEEPQRNVRYSRTSFAKKFSSAALTNASRGNIVVTTRKRTCCGFVPLSIGTLLMLVIFLSVAIVTVVKVAPTKYEGSGFVAAVAFLTYLEIYNIISAIMLMFGMYTVFTRNTKLLRAFVAYFCAWDLLIFMVNTGLYSYLIFLSPNSPEEASSKTGPWMPLPTMGAGTCVTCVEMPTVRAQLCEIIFISSMLLAVFRVYASYTTLRFYWYVQSGIFLRSGPRTTAFNNYGINGLSINFPTPMKPSQNVQRRSKSPELKEIQLQ